MRIFGIDFTSAPTRRKPITCSICELDAERLHVEEVKKWPSFESFEAFLHSPGPWVAGMDFSFGQSQTFLHNIGWPDHWPDYVAHVAAMSKPAFVRALEDYKAPRQAGDKEHKRASDSVTGALSPQKLYGIPIARMFYQGAPRLLASGATIAGLKSGDPDRLVFESYPGVLARRVTKSGYKSDDRKKHSEAHRDARQLIVDYVFGDGLFVDYGLSVSVAHELEDDPSGDILDAVLCAVQAAWAWRDWDRLQRQLTPTQRLEGWIADPAVFCD